MNHFLPLKIIAITLLVCVSASAVAEQTTVSVKYELGNNQHSLNNIIDVSIIDAVVSVDFSRLPSRLFIPGEGSTKKLESVRFSRSPNVAPNANGSLPPGDYLFNFLVEYEDSDDSFYFEGALPITISGPAHPGNTNRKITFIHTDLLGSPVANTDANGAVIK